MTIEPIGAGRTRMSIESRFPSTEAMEQVLAMGMEEGLTQAVGQIDAILAEDADVPGGDTMTTMTEPTTHTLDVPGAVLTYDVRPADRLHRCPGAAPHRFADGRRRVRHARRPLHRSHRGDLRPARRRAQREGRSGQPSRRPEQHADDLHRIIAELGCGPVDLFASSGGAVNALALVAAHPEQVRTLVAHEPPLASILPDREGAMAFTQAIHDTYQRSGFGAGMAQFIVAVSHQGPMTGRVRQRNRRPIRRCSGCRPRTTAPAPTRCSARTSSRARTTSPTSTRCAPRSTRIVVAAGVESDGPDGAPRRGGRRRATRDDGRCRSRAITVASWVDEYGQAGDPDAFAAKLREVLAEA